MKIITSNVQSLFGRCPGLFERRPCVVNVCEDSASLQQTLHQATFDNIDELDFQLHQ